MSLSWIGLTAVIFLLCQGWMATLYRDAILWRKNQILLDNTSIEMGRSDREILNGILKLNEQIRKLEIAHHTLHACAKIPILGIPCIKPDKALEVTIRGLVEFGERFAKTRWVTNLVLANASLGKKGAVFSRPSLLIQRNICPVCRHENGLRVLNPSLITRVFLRKSPRDLQSGYIVNQQTSKESYNYQLLPDQKSHFGG